MSQFKILPRVTPFLLILSLLMVPCQSVQAATSCKPIKTSIKLNLPTLRSGSNWDLVSDVAQFTDSDGNYCFAYNGKKSIAIVTTNKGVPHEKKLYLKKKYPLFGGITCDSNGNYYLVTGKENETSDTSVKTIFISKYDKKGRHIKTVGDNGTSSLASYYDSSFNTQVPFDAGNCEIAVNGDYLSVNYARTMYSGHQSNSVFTINMTDMTKVNFAGIYNSHSFAQRSIAWSNGFLYASEGDCYDRAFTLTTADPETQTFLNSNSFHFWVEKGTLDRWDMYTLNDNFARMGGLTAVNDETAALAATSVKAMDSRAEKQPQQLFLQIFYPGSDLSDPSSYVTTGKRSGLSGPNGNEKAVDYGVKWLTNVKSNTTISNPQIASDGNGTIIVLYEKYIDYDFKGVFYQILDEKGNQIESETCFSKTAQLNPCRMPVYTKGSIYWTANKRDDPYDKKYLYVYRLKL